MKNKYFTLYLYSLFVFFFISCTSTIEEQYILDRVEDCVDTYPDSAFEYLRQIKYPEKLHGKQQADYALLLTQTLDKNCLDSLQSDSLIALAVKYYEENGDETRTGKAYYYYGKVLVLNKRYSEAMRAYLNSLTKLVGTEEYKMQGLLWEHIGYLNSTQGFYKSSIANHREAIKYYDLAGDKDGVAYGYRNLARGYLYIHKNDSAFWYANKGLMLLDSTANHIKASFLQLLGLIAMDGNQYSQAVTYLMAAIEKCNNINDRMRYYFSLGRIYLALGEYEKAKQSFSYSKNATDLFIASGAHDYLYRMSKAEANYRKALHYRELSDSILNIIHNADLRNQLLDLQEKYKNDKLVLENKQVKLEKQNQTYFYSHLLWLVIIVGGLIVWYIKKKYRKLFVRNIEIIRQNNLQIEMYAYRIASLEMANVNEHESKKEELGKLNRKILHLTVENKKLRENSSVEALYVLEELKQGRLILKNMTAAECQHLFVFLDLVYADFITRIHKEFKLTKNELLLAALLKVGLSNQQLMFVFDCEIKSVYKNRQRLKLKMGISKDDSLEQFILFY